MYDVWIQVANSLTMVAESKRTEQFIYKFYYYEFFFLKPSQDTATLNWMGTALPNHPPPPPPQHKHLLNCYSFARLTQNLQLTHELAHRALWSSSAVVIAQCLFKLEIRTIDRVTFKRIWHNISNVYLRTSWLAMWLVGRPGGRGKGNSIIFFLSFLTHSACQYEVT